MQHPGERAIRGEIVVHAPIDRVWEAWATQAGAEAFFGPRCTIDPRPYGKYEILFNLDDEPGRRGAEGMIVLAVQRPTMISFTWNAPPELPTVRGQLTHVTIRLHPIDSDHTHVVLTHDGWGVGGEWDAAYAYFVRAWTQVVLPRLKVRFEVGPVDWDNPPDLTGPAA